MKQTVVSSEIRVRGRRKWLGEAAAAMALSVLAGLVRLPRKNPVERPSRHLHGSASSTPSVIGALRSWVWSR